VSARASAWARAAVVAALAALAALACGGPSPDGRFAVVAPSRASFTPVGLYLAHRCGSLDCHGAVTRNLKIYGADGLRLDPADLAGQGMTTVAELDVDYRSVVALEPEAMAAVVEDGGARPDRLSLIRKARGQERHPTPRLVQVGDDQDVCLTSWLAGAVDEGACARALTTP
jgi:hypothetical protein